MRQRAASRRRRGPLLVLALAATAGGWTAGGWTAGGWTAGGWTAGAHASRFPAAPPPAHTGGFGEATCAACHFGETEDDPRGALELTGLPERYAPGERYRLAIRLRHPLLAAAGFQVAARTAAGEGGGAAGGLAPVDDRTAATLANGVTYLAQSETGSAARDSAAWTVEWTAPGDGSAEVLFHLVGNAADGDESQFGDHVYAVERRTLPNEARGRR